MLEFVDLMEARSLGIQEDEQSMDKFWFSSQWILEPIYVGIRYQCLLDDEGEVKFLGKKQTYNQQNSMYLLTDLIQEIKNSKLPANTLFEGYITFNNDQQKAYKFIKSNVVDDEMLKDFVFYVTDLIYLDNKGIFDLPLFERRSKLKSLVTEGKLVKLQKGYTLKKKEVYSSLKNDFKVFLFKDLESHYSFKQSMAWRILKTPKSFFMTILGFVENDSEKFNGMVMALEGGQVVDGQIKKIMNVPVHSEDNRIWLYNSKCDLMGKVFEINALDGAKKGKYQETRFVRIRNDKKQNDCVFVEEA
jgi:ATP-dependent DNA ligase